MRHQKTRHKLSRSTAHRKALLANLCKEVIEHERIKTSEAKAKAVKPEIEKLITLAKRGDLHARRQALATLGQDKFAVYKLFDEVAPRYVERNGGYTRILKLGPRNGDGAPMALIELVDGGVSTTTEGATEDEGGRRRRLRAPRRRGRGDTPQDKPVRSKAAEASAAGSGDGPDVEAPDEVADETLEAEAQAEAESVADTADQAESAAQEADTGQVQNAESGGAPQDTQG
jgi:large subunit ribosomal protein L17